MSASPEQGGNTSESTYVVDAESAAEMARLVRQDQLLTQDMGGIFPENPDLSNVQRIVDLACGPGGWVLEVAFRYTDIEVVGVDISQRMIDYASAKARVQRLSNASFQVMNILKPLAFDDASFDLVNTRMIATFMPRDAWPKLFAECLRILRPGGILRFTDVEVGMSNKPAFEKAWNMVEQAMSRANMNFSPNGLHWGIIHMLPRFFQQAGLHHIGKMAYAVDFSAGTEIREGFYHDFASGFQSVEPFMEKMRVATVAEWREVYQKALTEMGEEDFCAMWILLTVWGQKPA
jgi:ubiquinone/menaquinone biosynthesis C-methylase UbiE